MSESPTRKRTRKAKQETLLLHVNLPANLVRAVRSLSDEEHRTITAQVTLLLEESEKLSSYIQPTTAESSD